MKSLIPFLLVILLIGACKSTGNLTDGQDGNLESAKPLGKILEGFSSPESVLLARTGMFISNVGTALQPREEDGDGYITKLSREGEMINERFIIELNAPKGMAEVDGTLYVADINQVKAFKSENGEPVQVFDFSMYGATFLNDITVKSSDVLLISDSDLNIIFSLNIRSGRVEKTQLPDGFMGVNGLHYDQVTQRLLVVGFGFEQEPNGGVAIIYPQDNTEVGLGQVEILDTPKGKYDGIALVDGKYIVFSDWGDGEGRLRYYNPTTKETWLINIANKIAGPADFAFDEQNKCLWIPAMQEGKVYQEFLDFY